jgi:quinoprotein dehydrogenase-associated probable ABC transporter substrate-binding protein
LDKREFRAMRPFLSVVIGMAGLWLSAAAMGQTSDLVDRNVLRVCADPANMPFTDQAGEGFENRVGELLARDLGIPLEYTWYPMATGFYRLTLGAKRCDVVMGTVASSEPMLNTNPYYKSAWVLVTRADTPLKDVTRLDDPGLVGKHLGVIAGTPPATILVMHNLMAGAKPYALVVDRRFENPAADMIADIAAGTIDGGILWGPVAGYYARRAGTPLSLQPLVNEKEGPPMVFRVTLGIRPGEQNWKHRLNDFLAANQGEIEAILLDYGVPVLDEQNRLVTRAETPLR